MNTGFDAIHFPTNWFYKIREIEILFISLFTETRHNQLQTTNYKLQTKNYKLRTTLLTGNPITL